MDEAAEGQPANKSFKLYLFYCSHPFSWAGASFPCARSCGIGVGRSLISGERHYSRRFRVDTEKITRPGAVMSLLRQLLHWNILFQA